MSHPDLSPTPTSAKPREIDYVPEGLAVQVDFAPMPEKDSFAASSPYGDCRFRESPLRSVYDVRTTAVSEIHSCGPGLSGSRNIRTIQTIFTNGIAKNSSTRNSRSARRPLLTGPPSMSETTFRPVSLRPGVVPKMRPITKRNARTIMTTKYMTSTYSSNHGSTHGWIVPLSSKLHSHSSPAARVIQPSSPKAATRSPSRATLCSPLGRSAVSVIVSSSVVTGSQASRYENPIFNSWFSPMEIRAAYGREATHCSESVGAMFQRGADWSRSAPIVARRSCKGARNRVGNE